MFHLRNLSKFIQQSFYQIKDIRSIIQRWSLQVEVNQQTGTSSGASTCASLSVRFVFIPPLKKMRWSVSQPSKGFLHKTFSGLVCFFVHESVRSLYVRVVRFLRDYGTCTSASIAIPTLVKRSPFVSSPSFWHTKNILSIR